MGVHRYYYWKLLKELYNDYLSVNNKYPKFIDKAYTRISHWKHDPHIYVGSGGGSVNIELGIGKVMNNFATQS